MRALLASYGLKFISGWYSTELLTRSVEDEIAACQHHLAKLKHNGCKVMLRSCPPGSGVVGSGVRVVGREASGFRARPRRCSSVVERTLGKGEVVGSTPISGSLEGLFTGAFGQEIRARSGKD